MLNKKQSIPQVCTWGMGFLDTPINKMPVKIGDWFEIYFSLSRGFIIYRFFCPDNRKI
ncbi:MAG TPA: hypothetical protein PLT61_02535 [Acinetobacter johnsonii]|nr:hypothetical protein [Acinetobacter johnsonii]